MVIYKAMCDLLWTLWGRSVANRNPAEDFAAYARELLLPGADENDGFGVEATPRRGKRRARAASFASVADAIACSMAGAAISRPAFRIVSRSTLPRPG
jgi:hypothetical protein